MALITLVLMPSNYAFQGKVGQKDLPKNGYSDKKELSIDGYGSEMEWSWTFEEKETKSIAVLECTNACQGKKHTKHEDCDLSCDDACDKRPGQFAHYKVLAPTMEDIDSKGNSLPAGTNDKKINEDFVKFGIPSLVSANSKVTTSVDKAFSKKYDGGTWVVTCSSDHWNKSPCSTSVKIIDVKVYWVTVDYRMWDNSKEADGTTKHTDGPKGTLKYKVTIPDGGTLRVAGTSITCKCQVLQEPPPKDHGYIPGHNGSGGEYAYVDNGGTKEMVTGAVLNGVVKEITCHDMTKATLVVGPTANAVFIPAGWEFDCVDGSCQDVQIVENILIEASLLERRIEVNISPTYDFQKTLRLMCLEIEKPEPREGKKYVLLPPSSPALARLAQLTRDTRFRGPWDQVRLWIATDFATPEKIAKVLIPAPGPGTYVRELFKAAIVDAISTKDPRIAKLMSPALLLAENFDGPAVEWFLNERLLADEAATCKWLIGQGSAIAELFKKGDSKDDLELLGRIVRTLGRRGSAASVGAAIWVLSKGCPDAYRQALIDSAWGTDFAMSLGEMDMEAARATLEWLSTAKPAYAAIAALGLNDDHKEKLGALAKAVVESNPGPKRGG